MGHGADAACQKKGADMTDLLSLSGVTKRYGGLVAVDDVNLDVPVGQVTSVVGPNGAGKSTLFSVIGGQQRPDAGEVRWRDGDLARARPERRAKMGVTRTFQTSRLIPGFTVLENVMVGCHVRGRSWFVEDILGSPRRQAEDARFRARSLECLELVGLAGRAAERSDTLAYGHRRLVEIARALAPEPAMLLLDEPAAGLHTHEADELGDLLIRLSRDHGLGVLLVEHNMGLVMRISAQVAVLDFGRLIACGTPQEVAADPGVREAYLGAVPSIAEGGAHA